MQSNDEAVSAERSLACLKIKPLEIITCNSSLLRWWAELSSLMPPRFYSSEVTPSAATFSFLLVIRADVWRNQPMN